MICKILNFVLSVILIIAVSGWMMGIRPMIILSGSMQPAIETGSICLVNTKVGYSKIKSEDIITFNLRDVKVTHRVQKITRDGIITKGDANEVSDLGVVTEKTYYGKVIGSVPYLGFIFQYIRNHMAFFATASVIVLIPWKKLFRIRKRKIVREGLKNEV